MSVISVELPDGRSVEVDAVGPDDGKPVLYFHSPATNGEELEAAAPAAGQLGLRLLTVRRSSIAGADPENFVAVAAEVTVATATALEIERPAVLAWSGGTPYALASAAMLGTEVGPIHVVSPLPGPLSGPDAVPEQSARLQEVANTTADSPWVSGPAVLRDYLAVSKPWPFDRATISQPVTIWAATEDAVVPPHLARYLAGGLPDVAMIEVPGQHDWLMNNWAKVLAGLDRLGEAEARS